MLLEQLPIERIGVVSFNLSAPPDGVAVVLGDGSQPSREICVRQGIVGEPVFPVDREPESRRIHELLPSSILRMARRRASSSAFLADVHHPGILSPRLQFTMIAGQPGLRAFI
jgi:hypothetical protein